MGEDTELHVSPAFVHVTIRYNIKGSESEQETRSSGGGDGSYFSCVHLNLVAIERKTICLLLFWLHSHNSNMYIYLN